MGEERAAPGGHRVAARAGHDLRRQPPDRTAAVVEQTGLTGQRLAVLDHADDVPRALAQPSPADHDDLAGVAVDLEDVAADPAR